jgi:hypothetical protein
MHTNWQLNHCFVCFELGFMWFANDFFWNSKKETPRPHHENKPLQTLKRNQNPVHIKPSSNHKLHETNVLCCTKYLTIGILILSWEIKSLKLVWDIRTNKIVRSLKRYKQVQTKLIHDYLMSRVLYLLIHPLFTIHQTCPLTLPFSMHI